ncbi:MAG: LysE family transporter [Candidatus Babeliales bacterium]|nr:LysE family transporter [Candidatus Babeliales bacterium]
MSLFLAGVLIGFSVAVPVGPIGILCIQRTFLRGQLSGIFTGLGVACADAVYGSVAAFGLSFVYNFIEKQQLIIRILGALLLLIIGLKNLLTKEFKSPAINEPLKTDYISNLFNSYSSAFFITLTNPLTLFLFTGILSWLNIDIDQETAFNSASLVFGIFLGSFLWFFILSSLVVMFKKRFSFSYLKWMNIISGLAIILFAVMILLSILFINK